MNNEVAKECTILSDEEKITFPEVIQRLSQAGIELYYADLLASKKTYYAHQTAYTVDCLPTSKHEVSSFFNQEGVINALRLIQSGKIQYQEFIRKIKECGVISYMVFIKGNQAVYFGRKGEQYIEKFPKLK